ncbi:MAG: hypothetical protein AAGC63_01925, partial [Propionicimonas sp.]|nr:hypothetical protein [Propionicimonas sp.]
DLALRDDPTDSLDKDGQRPYSIDLQWVAPAAFDPAIHAFQIDFATDQAMKSSNGYRRVVGTDLGVPTTGSTTTTTTAGQQSTDTVESQEPSTPSSPASVTPTPGETASTTPSPTPSVTESPSTTPAPTETAPTVEPSSPEPTETATAAAASSDDGPRVVLLSAPSAANGVKKVYWARVTGLASNTNWYMRVKVFLKGDPNRRATSERSDAIMVKTLSPKGYITGSVTIPSGASYRDWVVAAYRGTDMHDQVALASNGSYRLTVRPGTYYVQAIYIGNGNFNSRWLASPNTGGRARNDSGGKATGVAVAVGKATGVAAIVPQSTASYSVKGDIDCPGAQSACTVDVAALGSAGTVIKQDRSDANGEYTIQGLPAGGYRIRISHSEERYKTKQVSVTVDSNGTTVNTSLSVRPWVKKYSATISGTKRVGKTLKVSSKAWIASELPVVRAVQKCQWQRNGANISGATKCSYKLTGADRGKSIRVRVVNYRYGFESNATYSKSYRVG